MAKKILIIDDDKIFSKILRDAFEGSPEKFEVITAFNGIDGLKIALEEAPDLIMLDLVMPQLEGIEFLKKLRADERGQNVPVLVETQLSDLEKMGQGVELGVRGYIIKATHSIDEILAQVRDILK